MQYRTITLVFFPFLNNVETIENNSESNGLSLLPPLCQHSESSKRNELFGTIIFIKSEKRKQ